MSNFPDIISCIICDDVRSEMGGKATLLGFYGVVPYVTLQLEDSTKPLPRLAFLFMAKPGPKGTYKIGLTVIDPRKKAIVSGDALASDFEIKESENTNTVVFIVTFPILKEHGQYEIQLLVDGEVKFHDSFLVKPQPSQ